MQPEMLKGLPFRPEFRLLRSGLEVLCKNILIFRTLLGFGRRSRLWFWGSLDPIPFPLLSCYVSNGFDNNTKRLKEFDQSTVVSRKGSQAPTPPTSVKGIGGKGAWGIRNDWRRDLWECYIVAKPDYSESKIVLAMVKQVYVQYLQPLIERNWDRSDFLQEESRI